MIEVQKEGWEMPQICNFFASTLYLETLLLSGKAINPNSLTLIKLSQHKDNHKHILNQCNMFLVSSELKKDDYPKKWKVSNLC